MTLRIYHHFAMQAIKHSLVFLCAYSNIANTKEIGMRHEGMTQIIGSVISSPCSISLKDRYQVIKFSPLKLNILSTKEQTDKYLQAFDIELHDCGSAYSFIDSKTWSIRFDGQGVENIDAFLLQGPSKGIGVSVLDDTKQIVIPGRSYPVFNQILKQGKPESIFLLRYFLRLELTGSPIQAGSYHGIVRFSIDYQ